ncbi:E3 ubiquitin-protein ligase Mdm2-like isoform X2 [Babylonia areolata]
MMSSSGESSDTQVVHIIQPPAVSIGASSISTENKDMQPSGIGEGAEVCTVGGVPHLVVGVHPLPATHHPCHQPDSASSSSSQQYSVEEQITTVRIPMRRPTSAFLEILHEVGAHGEVFTMGEIILHVKNYIIRHQLYDARDPRLVHCPNNPLGQVLQVDRFTINQAVSLFMKHTYPVPDSCIRIRRQLVKKAVGAEGASAAGVPQEGSGVTSTVTSTTDSQADRQDGATAAGVRREGGGGGAGGSCHQSHPGNRQKEEGVGCEGGGRTSVNIEYGDEVDGATPLFQVNMATTTTTSSSSQSSQLPLSQAPEEDSVSVQYDSDHFAVEYELESSDHRSESEHSSPSAAKDFVVVQKESDVEFWADYSETETSSDTELGDADKWRCEQCHTSNTPFYRNCSRCWVLRPGWLPDSSLPSSSSSPSLSLPLPRDPCSSRRRRYAATTSNDEQTPDPSHGSRWRSGESAKRRRIRVVSASSSERSSESLVSLSDDDDDDTPSTSAAAAADKRRGDAPSTSMGEGRDDSGMSSMAQGSSQETQGADSSSQSRPTDLPPTLTPSPSSTDDRRRPGGGKVRGGVVGEECLVCASRPKTGCIIHGSSGHQVCCYRCAKRLWRQGQPCPWCRRPIQKVIKNFVL